MLEAKQDHDKLKATVAAAQLVKLKVSKSTQTWVLHSQIAQRVRRTRSVATSNRRNELGSPGDELKGDRQTSRKAGEDRS